MSFNFNTRAYYILLKIIDNIDLNSLLEKISKAFVDDQKAKDNKDDMVNVFAMMDTTKLILKALIDSEKDCNELMAIVLDKTLPEIEAMNALEYIRFRKEFIQSIDWEALLGEHMQIILVLLNNQGDQEDQKQLIKSD